MLPSCDSKMIDVRWRWKWRLWHWFYVICIYNAYLTTTAHSRLVCRTRLHEPRIYEGAPAGQYVMTVRAYDEFGASHIIYRLVEGREMFFVEEDTGRLNTAKKIEKKVGESYNLLLVAVSGGQTESCPVEVKVTRLNRHAPVFRLPLYRVEIPYVTALRSVLLNVAAIDADVEDYNSEIYYFISQISKEDRGLTFSSTTWSSAINPFDGNNKQGPDEWMNAELDREEESFAGNLSLTNQSLASGWSQMKDRWVTVDRRSGAIYLNRALNKNIGLLRAKVLAVDGGSPPRWASTTLEVLIKTIGPPLNLTVNNITETNVRVCWRKPAIGDPKGFLVRFRSSRNDQDSVQDHTLNVTQGVAERPSCVYLTSLKPATDYELKVYGWRDEEVGMGSDIALFNTLTPRCLSQNMCGNGTCHPGTSLTSTSTVRNYYCECQEGFYGDSCQFFNPCAMQPCLNMGTCVNTSNDHYKCECVVGFYDDNCSSFDPCANANVGYCFNSGSCVSNSSHVYVCECPVGFYGSKCERMDPCLIQNSTRHICLNGGTCKNTSDIDYICVCAPGFAGSQCESNINDCSSSTCMNGGSCMDGINSFTCNCASGFTGALCQDEVNGCNSKPCQNGAVCEKRENAFVCLCPPGFYGDLCDQKTDYCKSSPCLNGGSCKNRNNRFDCLCLPEFQGTSCEFSAVCLEESTPVSKGIFNFNETFAGEAVKFKCPFGPHDVVLERKCIMQSYSNASWAPLNLTICRQQDMMEAENVTMQLLEMTKNGSLLGPREVNEVTEKIEVILDYAIRDAKIAKFMFGVISNLLDANETSFTDVSSNKASRRLIRLIENFIQAVDVRDQMHINTDNLVVQIQNVKPDTESRESNDVSNAVVFQGLPAKLPFHNTSSETTEDVPTMTVSSSVIQKAAREVKNVRLHFVAHKNAKLFREKDQASQATMDRATLNARPVFTVSVDKFNVTDMTNGVNYTIKKPLYGQWLCVFWVMSDDDDASEGFTGKWSTKGMTAFQNDEEITCSSNHMTSFSILLDPDPDEPVDPIQEKALSIISYIGSGLSVLGLVLTIITFSIFRCLNRDRSGKILLNLCVSMLLLNVSFLSGAFKSDELKKVGNVDQNSTSPGENSTNNSVSNSVYEKNALCTVVAVFTHYFLLTTLAWMTVEAINMYQLLIYVFATSESRFLLKRLFVAWGAPAVIVGVTAAVDIQYYNPTNQYCMLSATNPYVYYLTLLVPCCILLIVNTIVFIMVTKVLFQPRNGNGTLPHKNLGNNKWKAKNIVTFAQVRGAFTVMTLLGITWVFGALAFGPARTVFQYIFCVLNSLQGFLVFVVRCLQYPEARSAWLQFFQTGTLKKHRGTKITTTNSSNNSHVKLTLSNVTSSNSGSANANNQHVRERSSSTVTTCSVNERGFRQLQTAKVNGGSLNKNAEGGISTPSSWVYGGIGEEAKRNSSNGTYEEVPANNTKATGEPADTKEGHYTNWEYMTWQKKRDEELAEEEKQGFKSVWLVRDTTPERQSLGGAEDAPFIEEEEAAKESDETVVAETVMKHRGGSKAGALTDQGYGSAEHSPSSKRDEMTEHVL